MSKKRADATVAVFQRAVKEAEKACANARIWTECGPEALEGARAAVRWHYRAQRALRFLRRHGQSVSG